MAVAREMTGAAMGKQQYASSRRHHSRVGGGFSASFNYDIRLCRAQILTPPTDVPEASNAVVGEHDDN